MLDFLVPVEAAITIDQSVLRGARGNAVFHLREMLVIFDFITLFDSKIHGIRIYCVVIFVHQMMRLDDVMRVGCCGRYGMDIACAGVRSGMELHPEMPLVALLGLMHFRIVSIVFVFGRAGSPHNGGIHNRSAMHDQSGIIQALPDIRKQLFSNVVLLKEMTELEQCGSVGDPLVREIYAQNILHRKAIVHSIFHALVRQVEPVLHQIHTEPSFCANRPASLSDNKALSCRPRPARESSRPSTRGIVRAESDGCDCHIRNL